MRHWVLQIIELAISLGVFLIIVANTLIIFPLLEIPYPCSFPGIWGLRKVFNNTRWNAVDGILIFYNGSALSYLKFSLLYMYFWNLFLADTHVFTCVPLVASKLILKFNDFMETRASHFLEKQ